jgi:hypothetical protein
MGDPPQPAEVKKESSREVGGYIPRSSFYGGGGYRERSSLEQEFQRRRDDKMKQKKEL